MIFWPHPTGYDIFQYLTEILIPVINFPTNINMKYICKIWFEEHVPGHVRKKRPINSSESRVFYWLISTCILKHYFFICCKEPRARPRTSRRGSRTRRQSDRVNLDDSENDVIEISESYQALPLPLSFEDAGLEISLYIYICISFMSPIWLIVFNVFRKWLVLSLL